ncbi:MAG: hypothetical protein AB7P76_02840 [Candidatus Melainabacteria bacterium]
MFSHEPAGSAMAMPGYLGESALSGIQPHRLMERPDELGGPYQQKVDALTQYMVGQASDYERALANTDRIFHRVLDELQLFVESFRGALVQRMQPLIEQDRVPSMLEGRLTVQTDADRSVGILNLLWQTLSLTTRGGVKPLAYGRPGRPPVFAGRILAFHGDYLDPHGPLQTQNYPAVLQHEIASLYVPADPVSPAFMKIRHRPEEEIYFTQQEAARQFVLRVVEMTCGGGFFHEGTP